MVLGSDETGIRSPYNRITVKEILPDGNQKIVSSLLSNIGTMRDPPFFIVQVNHDFYMMNGTIDSRRYTNSTLFPRPLWNSIRCLT